MKATYLYCHWVVFFKVLSCFKQSSSTRTEACSCQQEGGTKIQGLQVHNWLWVRPLSEATQLHWDMEIAGMHFTVMLWGLGSSYRLFWRWKVPQKLRSQAFDFIPGAQCRRISNVVKCFRNTFFSWTSTQYISICFFPGKSLTDSACPFRSFRAWIAFSGLKKTFHDLFHIQM